MTSLVKDICKSMQINCLSMSLDDFYLTGAEQETIAIAHPDNPLLQYRGNGMRTNKILI